MTRLTTKKRIIAQRGLAKEGTYMLGRQFAYVARIIQRINASIISSVMQMINVVLNNNQGKF